MFARRKFAFIIALLFGISTAALAQEAQVTRAVGAVKSIQGTVIALKTDAGADVTVNVIDGARILRTAPGQTDLKTATPIQLSEVQAGDRILARGKGSDDGKTIVANTIVVMKQSDVAAKQQKEKDDWQRRGVGGPVKTIDAVTGTITLAATTPGAPAVTVHAGKDTIVRQYSPESVKFDDAKISSLSAVKVGDQLRARGNHAADGSLTAEEIVFGTFRNVAGTISSIDAANQTLTVMDLSTKKPVVVKFTPESQMHKLPQMLAQMIAFRLRGGEIPGAPGGNGQGGGQGGQRPQGASQPAQGGGARQGGQGGPGGARMGNNADLSQMLARMPLVALSDLQKGDALMIVTTQGNGTTVSAVTLLAGVEPILTAPNAQSILSPWNIGTGAAGEAQ